jgi:hypothetical protein
MQHSLLSEARSLKSKFKGKREKSKKIYKSHVSNNKQNTKDGMGKFKNLNKTTMRCHFFSNLAMVT